MDDLLGRESFGNYARGWLWDHPTMGERYRETWLRNLRLHLSDLEDVPLRGMTPALVRTWHAEAVRERAAGPRSLSPPVHAGGAEHRCLRGCDRSEPVSDPWGRVRAVA
jgi:hypothetical protein